MFANKLVSKTKKSPIISRLFSGGTWALGGKLLTLPLGVVINSVLARSLSPGNMGQFIFVQSIVMTGGVIALLGMGQTAVRTIAGPLGNDDFKAVQNNIRNLIQWCVIGILLIVVLLNIGGPFIGISRYVLPLATLWMIVFAWQRLLAEILRGFHDIRGAVIVAGGTFGGLITYVFAAGFIASGWLLFKRFELNQALWFMFAGTALTVIWATIQLLKTFRRKNLTIKNWFTAPSWTFLWLALPLVIHDITSLLLNQSGIWVLQAYQPPSEIALYGVAVRLVALIGVPLNLVNAVIAPTIAELYQKGEKNKLEVILRGLATLSSIPTWLILIVFIIAGDAILGLIFGEYYKVAQSILILLTLGSVINVTAGSCGLTLVMTGHQKTLMFISVAGGFLTLGFVLVAVQPFGAVGVAGAIALSLILKNLLMVLYTKKITGIWTLVTLDIRPYLEFARK